MSGKKESWFTPKGIMKILLFPLLIMVNPKIYFPYMEEEEEGPRKRDDAPPGPPGTGAPGA